MAKPEDVFFEDEGVRVSLAEIMAAVNFDGRTADSPCDLIVMDPDTLAMSGIRSTSRSRQLRPLAGAEGRPYDWRDWRPAPPTAAEIAAKPKRKPKPKQGRNRRCPS